MPKYYFHADDGRRHEDEQGTELPNLAAVREVALSTMMEMADALSHDFWNDQRLRITVTDDHGLTLMTLDLTAALSPALSAPAAY
jgi:hypothetical protein